MLSGKGCEWGASGVEDNVQDHVGSVGGPAASGTGHVYVAMLLMPCAMCASSYAMSVDCLAA